MSSHTAIHHASNLGPDVALIVIGVVFVAMVLLMLLAPGDGV